MVLDELGSMKVKDCDEGEGQRVSVRRLRGRRGKKRTVEIDASP